MMLISVARHQKLNNYFWSVRVVWIFSVVTTTITVITPVVSASYHLHNVQSSSGTSSLNLSLLYVQEKTVEPLVYDAEKYRAHLEQCKRKSKWSGWKEQKLISHFPCLALFVEKYKEDMGQTNQSGTRTHGEWTS
jgi:hypothetical protein